jgi:hypothetical protein
MATRPPAARADDASTASVRRYVPVTKANSDLPNGPCRGLCVGTAGTANLTEVDGTPRDNFPLQPGYNPLEVKQVRTGGTASDIWALY